MNNGSLFIISAPSGAGKTSLVKRLIANMDKLSVSVSHTTRAQRQGEIHGQDYFFISTAEFDAMFDTNDFLEYAQVFDNYYGTSQQTVANSIKQGLDVILEIDWQGAQQVRKMCPACISIFILPPSIAVLQQRLQQRGLDSEDIINRRMRDAVTEMRHYKEYDYLVVNDAFSEALAELQSIVHANRLRRIRREAELQDLTEALLKG